MIGIGKDTDIGYSTNWTDGNDAAVCADESPFSIWSDWNASQRDIFLLDAGGNLILHQNISTGIPDDLNGLIISLSLNNEKRPLFPEKVSLYQNYPNPFNPVTTLSYDLSDNELISINIYDMSGDLVVELFNGHQKVGHHFFKWNGTNNNGQPVTAGVYLYSIEAAGLLQTKKMILLK